MNQEEFEKKYRLKLFRAWSAGCTDEQAAKHAGCDYEELKGYLETSKVLREGRETRIDQILVKAQANVKKKIDEGDLKASEWYIEHMDYRFGGRKINVVEEEPEEELDDFLDGFEAKGGFDEQ